MKARSKLALSACLIALSLPPAAHANDALLGVLVGAGAGALIGQALGGRDGAIAGGVVGAVAGAAPSYRHEPQVAYGGAYVSYPQPAYMAPPPAVRVYPPVVYTAPVGAYPPYGYGAPPVVVVRSAPVVVINGGGYPHHVHGRYGRHGHPHGHPVGYWYR